MHSSFSLVFLSLILAGSPIQANAVVTNGSFSIQNCCTTLSKLLPGKVFLPGSANYIQEQSTYYSIEQMTTMPACRVSPSTAHDVSQIVAITDGGNCPFAVRSGGHMNFVGASNINSTGLTLDLENMNSITLSKDHNTVALSPGLRWIQVYNYLSQYNLTVLGGRAAPVGVGGFLVGGGISFFSPKLGLASNYIAEYEVVLSNGNVVTASETQNPSLHWALKLGSTNFGIVTKFTLRTVPLNGMWGGSLTFAEDQASALLQYLERFNQKLAQDPEGLSAVTLGFNSASSQYFALVSNAYLKPVSFPPLFSDLKQFIPSATSNSLAVSNLTTITSELAAGELPGFRTLWWTLTFIADSQSILDVYHIGKALFADLVSVNGTLWSINIQPINRLMIDATVAGNNPAGFVDGGDNLFLILQEVKWSDPSIDEKIKNASNQFLASAEDLGRKRNLLNQFLYLNYAGGDQPVYKNVGNTNLQKLMQVKNSYDPSNVFGRLWPGGHKL